jgi:hypothetical protein
MSSHIEPKVLAASERSTTPGSTWASNTVSTSRTLRGGFASWRKSQQAGTGFPPAPVKRAGRADAVTVVVLEFEPQADA